MPSCRFANARRRFISVNGLAHEARSVSREAQRSRSLPSRKGFERCWHVRALRFGMRLRKGQARGTGLLFLLLIVPAQNLVQEAFQGLLLVGALLIVPLRGLQRVLQHAL